MEGDNFCMPAQWTGRLIGEMHTNNVKHYELAEEAGLHLKYMSQILNGHRTPKDAEEKLFSALHRILERRSAANE